MTKQSKPHLWRVLSDAQPTASSTAQRDIYAAEIRALADWLGLEMPEPQLYVPSEFGGSIIQADVVAEWKVRQDIRQLLLAEADRAEAGD